MSDISLASADLERWVGQVNAALDLDDLPRATDLAEAALAQGVEHPFLLNLKAFRLEQQGRFEEARDVLRRALQLSPGDPLILTSIGFCFTKEGRPAEAARAFDAVLETNPDYALPHHGRGLAWESLGDDEAARRHHERAAELDPNYPDPLGALAALALKRKDVGAARGYAERALRLDPHQSAAALTLATLQVEAGEYEQAVQALDQLLGTDLAPLHRASAERLRADALDALDRPEAAMAAYVAANAALRSVYAAQFEGPGVETGVELCRRLAGYFDKASPETWRGAPGEAAQAGGAAAHVFLVGFPRSGTTLLEQVLASHPAVAALEEAPTLHEAAQAYFGDNAGLDRLAGLDASEADRWRRDYWDKVRDYGLDPAGKVFVDKQPLLTPWLPLVAKLFPEAKILFARRDPRDVVVSCFRRRFRPSPTIYEFTSLDRAALFYSAVMELAEIYRSKLALSEHVHRHEDLVADFDRETQAICGFLGLPWDPAMRDFAETAKRRDVRTPSAGQVRRGLYSEGVGQWRRYGAAIAPILPILQPWVERFGYPAA